MRNSEEYKYLLQKLKIVESMTINISKELESSDSDGMEYIRKLDGLFASRKNALMDLKRLMGAVNSLDDKILSERFSSLMEKDKNNLDKINEKVENIRTKLRILGKQKSVLLYR